MSAPLRWRLLAGFIVVFVAGLVAGAFLGAGQLRRHARADFGHHDSLSHRIRNRMQDRLDLTPEQMARAAPIFDKAARQLEAIRTETSQRVRATFTAADDELAPHLTPAQRTKLDALEAEHNANRAEQVALRDRRNSPHP